MSEASVTAAPAPRRPLIPPEVWSSITMGKSVPDYLRSLVTPFNVIAAAILAVGIPVLAYRFAFGLGAATNLTQTTPWGLWIGFDMLCGVALAAGGFTIAAAVHIFGLKEYHPIVRPAILTGFLGYAFAALGLIADLGRPWRIVWPIFTYGPTSVMFEVAWCVILYLSVLGLEFSISLWEWLGWKKLRATISKIMIALCVLGVCLSTLHQSSLGSLFLMAPTKLHPLWYTPFIPVHFFVTAVISGMAMVIVESSLSHRIFKWQLEGEHHDLTPLTIGLGKGAAVMLFAYFFIKVQALIEGHQWDLLATRMGAIYLVEVLGGVLLPSLLFAWGARNGKVGVVRFAAILTCVGIVMNRLDISIVAYNWDVPGHYFPSWMEIMVSVTLVTMLLICFRWIANRMPILRPHPDYAHDEH